MNSNKNEKMEMGCQCRQCGKVVYLNATLAQWKEYHSPNRRHIQDIFPEFTPGERELLISGMCDECFNDVFGQDDDDWD